MSANSFAVIKLFYAYIAIILYTLSSRTACFLVSGFSHTVKRNRIDCTLFYTVSKMSQKGNKTTQLFQMTDTALINTLSHVWGGKSSLHFPNAFNTIVYFMLIRRTVLSGVQNVLTITTRMNTRQEMFLAYELVLQHRFHIKIYHKDMVIVSN